MSRTVCKTCGSEIELRQHNADAPKRWIHVPSNDYRCLVFAEPYMPFGVPVVFVVTEEADQ